MFWPKIDVMSSLNELQRMRDEIDRFFSPARASTGYEFPLLNVWSSSEKAVLEAELPGLDPKDIDISISGDTITLKGERRPEENKEKDSYHRRERSFGKFSRTIKLPFDVDSNKAEARSTKGVLTLDLPLSESAKQKKITIKS